MWFEIDGQALLVDAPDPALQPAVDAIPLFLRHDHPDLPSLGFLRLRRGPLPDLRTRAEALIASGGKRIPQPAGAEAVVEVVIGPAQAVISWPDQGLAVLRADGTGAEVTVVEPDSLASAVLAAAAALAMIAEHGFSPIHASLVDLDGRGVMFCGERSRGKTTSCLALARAGWTVRADDRCFLRVRDGLPVVWGPGGEMRLRADAARLWPDLTEPMAQGRARGEKRVVSPAELGGHAAAGSVVRPALMFPEVVGHGPHRIERVAPAEALGEMLFSTGLAPLPAHAARQFRDLTALLEQAPCYRLHLGAEMDELPHAIAEVLT